MEIAVTTPTGNVGRHLVRSLVRAGVRPRLLTRRPDTLDPALVRRVEVAQVDLADARSLIAATAGVDAWYAVAPPGDAADPLDAYARLSRSFAAAVQENDIRRTVFQSSVGAELRHGAGEIDGLATVELALDAAAAGTSRGVVHLRCGYFHTNLLPQLDTILAGELPTLWPVDHAMPWVAPRDVAEVAAGLLLRSDWTGRHVQAVHGPCDLSWTEVAAILSGVTGTPVRATQIGDDELRASLTVAGMTPAQIEALVGMAVGLRSGFVPEQGRDLTTTTETTLGAWAYDHLADS